MHRQMKLAGAQDANTRAVHPAGEIQAGGSAAKKCFPGDRRRWRDKKSRKFRRQTNERVQKIFKIEQWYYMIVRGPVVDEAARMEEAGTQIPEAEYR